MTLHDWIDELCDALDIDVELDEGLVLDVARDVAHAVERPAAPLSAYLLGFAAARHGADPEALEELAGRVTALAEGWGREAGAAAEPEDVPVADLEDGVPDDADELVDAD